MQMDPASLRTLHAAIPLLRSDRAEAVVVAPDEDEDALSAGGACAEFLGHVFERTLPVLRESDFERAKRYRGRGIVAVGALGTHRLLTRLYLEGRHYCDARFPAHGGFVLRTIQGGSTEGTNVLLVSGNGAEGWDAAAEAFCDLLTYLDERATVPPTHLVQSSGAPLVLEPPQVVDETDRLLAALREDSAMAGAARLLACAQRYDAWGDVSVGIVVRNALEHLLRDQPDPHAPTAAWQTVPEQWLGPFARLWRNLEERPIFDGPLRDQISLFLLNATDALAERWRPATGHEVLSADLAGAASGLWWAGRLFGARHQLPRVATWRATAERLMALPRVWLPLADSGADAQAYALRESLRLALLSEQLPRLAAVAEAADQWLSVTLPAVPTAVHVGGGAAGCEDLAWLGGWSTWALEACSRRPRVPALEPSHLGLWPGALYRATLSEASPTETAIAALDWGASTAEWVASRSGVPLPDDPNTELLCGSVALRRRTGPQSDYLLVGASPGPGSPARGILSLLRCDLGGTVWLTGAAGEADAPAYRWCALTGRLHAGRLRVAALRTLDTTHPVSRCVVVHVPEKGFLVLRATREGSLSPLRLSVGPGVQGIQVAEDTIGLLTGGPTGPRWAVLRSLAGRLALAHPREPGASALTLAWPPAEPEATVWQALEFSLGSGGDGGWILAGKAPGPLLCALSGGRKAWVGADWSTLDPDGLVEARAEAWMLGGFLAFAGLERLAIGDAYIEASSPCEVLLDPTEQTARITAAASTELFVGTGTGRESAVLRPGAAFDTPFALGAEIHALLVARAKLVASEEAPPDEGSNRGDDAGDGPPHH